MAEVTIKNEQTEVLIANIGGEQYSIPLGGSLPWKRLKALKGLKSDDDLVAFLGDYIPEKVLEDLTYGEILKLVKAWRDATQEAAGVSVGES